MSTRRRRPTAVTGAVALALALAGCGLPFASSDPTTVTATSTVTRNVTNEQRQLTTKQIRAAMPVGLLEADGWTRQQRIPDPTASSTASPTGDGRIGAKPSTCLPVLLVGDRIEQHNTQHRVAKESVDRETADGTSSISVTVASFDEPYPQEILDESGAALSTCGSFTLTQSGHDFPITSSPMPGPDLGEQSLSYRYSFEHDVHIHILVIRSGNNLVTNTMVTSDESSQEAKLTSYAAAVLDNLKKG